ncbi:MULTISPECIES: DUF6572 domain-containing protein [Listeria]|uniref:Branched-chain amino acid ABC transporter substrate-binding protein n=1 Tax=Listeria riparia FSL S10-1204 TaxID=1265816 RepID=W7D770_9LIST|nr:MULTISPECIES: DUF6572 domain-containing protein [Listeria]EUJ44900.1 hypothetical protein PRIP_08687 [Listeria riparia FSL S10-1204]MBC1513851.1 branched-chain amino acid ABC transporter substrate-binding protein [Listeria booriae]MBC6152907.1 branched-chain amino acid ABC transporter substrate-binding protein [Listeria booriae]MBC6307225.1 branched-chain amino acid ABC transporter substrate-binding protein [Listeria booriae]
MSVSEKDKIDGMGKSLEENALLFLITDHLEWEDEYGHLITLQDKINAYIGFIESEQYKAEYEEHLFDKYIIEIHFKHGVTDKCMSFLNTVSEQVKVLNIEIKLELV